MLNHNFYFNILLFFFFAVLIYFFRFSIYKKINIYDIPDGNLKKHLQKTSLTGGFIYFFYLFVILIYIFFDKNFFFYFTQDSEYKIFSLYFSIIGFFLIGVYDDKFILNYNIKIILFFIITYISLTLDHTLIVDKIIFSFTDKIFYLEGLSKFFSILCIFIFINALNLYDGIDLQSGTYILSFLIFLAYLTNLDIFFYFCIPTILFLILNKKKEVFLGDNGTLLMGFLLSYFIIKIYNSSLIFADEIIILMIIPIIDMFRLFVIRLSKGKNPLKGDRNHIHHLLLQKYGYYKTIIILNFLIVSPILLLFLNIKNYIIIPITITSYLFFILKK